MNSRNFPIFKRFTPKLTKTSISKLSGLVSDVPVTIDNTFHQKSVRVCVLGADTPVGEATSFLLKQNPVVSQIYLYGDTEVRGIVADLRHMDTRSEVKAYTGKDGLAKAIRRADIVLFIGRDNDPLNATPENKLRNEARRIVEFSEACSRYAPKSLITVCINPVSATVPLVAAIFRRTHWYHPGRIIGSVALTQIRANTITARYQDLDPVCVNVPLIGGPEIDTVVPLFSRATPVNLMPSDCSILQESMRNAEVESTINPCKLVISPLSEAYGINHLVTTMGLGLCGDDSAICAAYVRQNMLYGCRHLVTTVKFGPGGVVHNYGIPKLTGFELRLLEKSLLQLNKREQMSLDVLSEMEKHKGTQNIASLVHLTPIADKAKQKRD